MGVYTVISICLHFINKDMVLKAPMDQLWILKVYNVQVAFLCVNPGTKMHVQIPDKMIALVVVTAEE